jgi:hypothetical protein
MFDVRGQARAYHRFKAKKRRIYARPTFAGAGIQAAEKAPNLFVISSGARNLSFLPYAYIEERFLAPLGMKKNKLPIPQAVCRALPALSIGPDWGGNFHLEMQYNSGRFEEFELLRASEE